MLNEDEIILINLSKFVLHFFYTVLKGKFRFLKKLSRLSVSESCLFYLLMTICFIVKLPMCMLGVCKIYPVSCYE